MKPNKITEYSVEGLVDGRWLGGMEKRGIRGFNLIDQLLWDAHRGEYARCTALQCTGQGKELKIMLAYMLREADGVICLLSRIS